MSLFSIVIRNLARRPTRSLLTVLGVAIGIAAVVSLTSLAWGFERAWEGVNRARGTDLIVLRSSGRSLVPSPFPEEVAPVVGDIDGVAASAGVLSELMSIEDAPTVLVHGWSPGAFLWTHLTLTDGRWPEPDERAVLIGTIAADTMGKSVGDSLQVDIEEFRVCGVFDSPAVSERSAVIMPLSQLQALTSRDGMINVVNVRMAAGSSPGVVERMRQAIGEQVGDGFRVYDATEAADANIGLQLVKAVSFGMSIIAAAVGAVGVMNSVLMSVFERLHEIGILLAIGWKRRRIVQMILMESILLSALGAGAGILGGLASLRLLLTTRALRGQIDPESGWLLLVTVLAVTLLIGATGGVYPAWRGARMVPTDAIRRD